MLYVNNNSLTLIIKGYLANMYTKAADFTRLSCTNFSFNKVLFFNSLCHNYMVLEIIRKCVFLTITPIMIVNKQEA